MMSIPQIQIIVDIVFFLTILLLLWQLNRRMGRQRPPVDPKVVRELEKIMADSQECVNQFMKVVEENETAMNKLLRRLDIKEKQLIILIERAEVLTMQNDSRMSEAEQIPSTQRYDHILKMIQQGLSREEVAKRSGLTEGEINLVIELAHARMGRV